MNFSKKNKATKQFHAIWNKYHDPYEIKKRLNQRKQKIIKEEKLSSFGIYERDK